MSEQQQSTEVEFKRIFAHAIGLYPGAGAHEGSGSAYWQFLRRYPLPVLREAFRRAVLGSPEFFPSAVRVRECAEAAAKTDALHAAPAARQLEAPRGYVPAIGAGAEEWINEASNPFDRLARHWQVESKAKGWDRGREMPHEDGLRRLKEFWATWNQNTTKAKQVSTQEPTNSPAAERPTS